MTFCFTGITTLVSSWNRDRWRTISLAGGFFILSLILKFVGRMWAAGGWLRYLTFLSLFEPQELILVPSPGGWPGLRYDAILVLLGLLSYAAAAVIFWRRDIPAPTVVPSPVGRGLAVERVRRRCGDAVCRRQDCYVQSD